MSDADRDKKAQGFDLGTLKPEHLSGRPKRVGRVGKSPVFSATTTGGLSLIFVSKDGRSLDGIGAGSHPGIAQWIAEKRAPTLVWDDVMKSERVPPPPHLLEKYESLTDAFSASCRRRR